jgi:prephenate dehydrogenase
MKHVCIVGLGLIGGSLGMSLRRVRRGGKRVYHVTGLGRSASDLRAAKRKGAVDAFSIKASHAVPTADIIVLCVPVQFIAPVAKKILPFIKRGAVVTDV